MVLRTKMLGGMAVGRIVARGRVDRQLRGLE